jgi:mono/diheme cytochrome c family protein
MSRNVIALLSVCLAAAATAQTVDSVYYESTVRPILRNNCFACHTAKSLTSGLSLETREAILHGGNRGPAANKDKPAASLLVEAMRHSGDAPKMPPGGRKLTDEQIAAVEKWIAADMPMPASAQASKRRGADHWSFQAPKKTAPPTVSDPGWPKNTLDYFILAKLDAAKLKPAPEAPRATLLRRVSLDLAGLPPTPEEIASFVADTRADAYDRAVDRLLASQHYGERWGRHWLDLARYADSDGYTIDAPREIWKYRDWVIKAMNDDQPFDRFVIEQYAGDLLPNPTNEQLIATGFHRNTPSNFEGGIDFEQYRVEAVADRVATTGAVFLGLTIGCARCHDHKYDPISQREFYQIFAFLNNVDEVDKEADRNRFNKPFLEFGTPAEIAKQAANTAQVRLLEGEIENFRMTLTSLNEEQKKKDPGLAERLEALRILRRRSPKIVSTLIMRELETPREAYIHLNGDFLRKGAAVEPGALVVMNALGAPANGKRHNRLDLGRWLVDRSNPLTARVTVNRMWQRYFGKGIVDTDSDFGTQGDKPSHQELLDWLAVDFMDRGWSQKAVHRLIVTSAAYRQSSVARPDALAIDPDNKLLARQERLRLDAEIVRDASLVAAGVFHPAVGGPSVYPPQPAGVYQVTQVRREWKTSTGGDRYRRGLYTFFQRSAPHPSLIVFDAPDATVSCTRRVRSNTPLQALTQLNDDTTKELSEAMSERIAKETGEATDDAARLRQGFLMALNRAPRAEESERLLRYLAAQRDSAKPGDTAAGDKRAWASVARVLLNLDEFLTRE